MFGASAETTRVLDMLEDLGNAIRIKRTQLGLTLRDVGDATGVGHATIHRIETGMVDPRIGSVIPVLRWLFDDQSEDQSEDHND